LVEKKKTLTLNVKCMCITTNIKIKDMTNIKFKFDRSVVFYGYTSFLLQ
jgi:hypothetical protein